jgi:peptidoglycan-associated lipoprotein
MKKHLTIIMLFAAMGICSAQTNLELAYEAFGAKEYAAALPLFEKALKKPEKKTDLADIKFKVAECYRYNGKPDEAIDWYNQAKAEGYANPNYLFHQANIYLKQGKYEQAQKKFENFLEAQPNDKDATRLLNNCKYALTTAQDSSLYTFKNEKELNTIYSDYAAAPLKYLLVFTSSRISEKGEAVYSYDGQGFSDLYQAAYYKEDKTWSKAKKLEPISAAGNDGVLSYCEKTKTVYFTRCNDGKGKNNYCRIFEASYDDATNIFETPKPIALSFQQKGDMEQPAIATNGDKLWFASRMEGGNGGSDLWYMRKEGDSWSEPVNAGTVINTEFDEMFPVLRDSVLYYSSEGNIGYGGLDLYYATLSNGSWTKPVNLKAPFNSSGDDFFIVYNSDNKSGYFSSNRSGGAGSDDIYSFFLTPVNILVKGRISDMETSQPIAGAVVVLSAADGTSDTTTTNANGEYLFNLDKDKDYKINVLNPGYFGDSRKLSTQGVKASKEYSKANGQNYDFAIKRIPKEEIKIDNIYYDYDSYNLREESKPSLDKLVKLLEDTPGALVQINSHTDERGKFDYNLTLSENRAKSVVEYLISKGISAGRLSSKGFSSSQPVVKNAKTEEEHQMNRRTTFQVLKND